MLQVELKLLKKKKKMSKTELILLISHIGFFLWFYVGYRFGKNKTKEK